MVDFPIFYDAQEDMRNHLVVIGHETDLDNVRDCEKAIYVCRSQDADAIGVTKQNTIIILDDAADVKKVFNSLLRIVDKFNNWHKRMNEIVQQLSPFSALIDECDNVIEEPMALIDSQFNFVAYSSFSKDIGFVDRYVNHENGGQLNIDVMQQLKAAPDYIESLFIRGVYDYMCENHFFARNIFFNNNYMGQLDIPVTNNQDQNEYHKCILGYIGNYVEDLYSRCGSFRRDGAKTGRLKYLLIDLLSRRIVDIDVIKSILDENEHLPDDEYCLIQFKTSLSRSTDSYLPYLTMQLETGWPGTVGFEFDGKLFQLVNKSKYQRILEGDFFQKVPYFLRDTLLLAGISRSFNNILQINAAYRQTEIALEYGYARNPTFWYFKFDDLAFEYLLKNGPSGFQPNEICAIGIVTLRNHDKKFNTNYYKTIYHYIEHKYNASAAAKSLYIVRSSFLNRMARIAELTAIDWDNFDTRLYLELSCKLFGK